MSDDFEVKMSRLNRKISRDGETVDVFIYQDGEGGWILEVEDRFRNSTLWDEPFKSDLDALNAVLAAIEQDGIGSLVGI
jgi:hypothetical protein